MKMEDTNMNEENVTVNGAGTQDNTSFSFGTHAEMVIWCSELTITNAFSDIINKICDWK